MTKPILDLRPLRYFLAVAEEGQITRAAERLHFAQPALSQALAKLESDLGVRLLDRHARGVTLTVAGEAFIQKLRIAMTALDEAQDAVNPWVRGDLRLVVGFLPSLGPVARSPLRRLMRAHPEIDVETRHLTVGARLTELKRKQIDVEIVFPPPEEPDVIAETLILSPRFVVLSDSHRLAGETSLAFEQIEDETFPGRHPSVSEQWAREAFLTGYRGSQQPRAVETPTTLDEMWALVSAEKAIAVLPEFMVRGTEGEGVRAIPLTDVPPVEVCIARRREDSRQAVRAFFETVAGSLDGRSSEGDVS
jgi:DNA-binding transcriptional LysR family regulator